MAVPDYQTLMLPVLRLAARGEISIRACIDTLAEQLGLSQEDRNQLLPSGKQAIFDNRVHWAKTYLVKAGVLEARRRGHFKAAPRGLEILKNDPARIDNESLEKYSEFQDFRARSTPKNVQPELGSPPDISTIVDKSTPEERIESAYEEITFELRSDLLDRIVAAKPEFFETLIIDLMIAMRYGGSRRDAGQRLGKSGDGASMA